MKKFYMYNVEEAIAKIVKQNWYEFDRDGFIITTIEKIARKMHPQLYRYQLELTKVIQNWWKHCPKLKVPDKKLIQKVIYSDDKWIYLAEPVNAMHDFYGYFDEDKENGCLLHINRYKKNRAI